MKHIKIVSGRKTLCDKKIDDCDKCPMYEYDLYAGIEWCGMLDDQLIRGGGALFDPIPKECPLQDVPGDITSKD